MRGPLGAADATMLLSNTCGATATRTATTPKAPHARLARHCLSRPVESETYSCCWRHKGPTNHGQASSGCPHQLLRLRMGRRLSKGSHTQCSHPEFNQDTSHQQTHIRARLSAVCITVAGCSTGLEASHIRPVTPCMACHTVCSTKAMWGAGLKDCCVGRWW